MSVESSAASANTEQPAVFPLVPPPTGRRRYRVSWGLWFFLLCKVVSLALLLLHHRIAALAIFLIPDPWFICQFVVPTTQGWGPVLTHFATTRREVWLTIDDGPDPATTPEVLALLARHQAHATFFLVGEKVNRHPELVVEILRQGHSIGNHSQSHPSATFWCSPVSTVRTEIDLCTAALRSAGCPPTRWFRPPVGIKNLFLHRELAGRGMDLVLWSARGYDSLASTPDAVFKRIVRDIRPGAIVLLHESGRSDSPRVAAIEKLLAHLQQEQFSCVIPAPETLESG